MANSISEAKRVLTEEANAIIKAAESLDSNFEAACEMIANAQKVIVSGIGKSGLIGKKISSTFSSIGIPALFLHPVEALHGDIGIVSENDVSLLISKSGSTDELAMLFPYLSKRTKIISITANKESFLAKNSDHHIYLPIDKEACPIELAPTTSTTVTLAIGDAIAACVMKLNGFKQEDFAKNHPLGQLGKNLTLTVKDIMHKGVDLPTVELGSSFKAALIEMTDKALGCLCIVENGVLKGIITDGDTRRALNKFENLSELKVDDVMTESPITVKPKALLGEALSIMENRKSQINVLPVVEDDSTCVGVLRIHDIIKSRF